jgi:hypothetical protein
MDVLAATRAADQLLAEVKDDRHRAILANYRRHVLLELAGRWPEILRPEMTVPYPVYRMAVGGQTTVYSGNEEVAGFYRGLVDAGLTVSVAVEEKLAVADWGLAFEACYEQILPGEVIAAQGFPVGSPDGTYRFTLVVAGIWSYDENAKLIGEHIYSDTGSAHIEPADPADIVTPERAAELVTPLLDQSL